LGVVKALGGLYQHSQTGPFVSSEKIFEKEQRL